MEIGLVVGIYSRHAVWYTIADDEYRRFTRYVYEWRREWRRRFTTPRAVARATSTEFTRSIITRTCERERNRERIHI